jgi:hypothetical protein
MVQMNWSSRFLPRRPANPTRRWPGYPPGYAPRSGSIRRFGAPGARRIHPLKVWPRFGARCYLDLPGGIQRVPTMVYRLSSAGREGAQWWRPQKGLGIGSTYGGSATQALSRGRQGASFCRVKPNKNAAISHFLVVLRLYVERATLSRTWSASTGPDSAQLFLRGLGFIPEPSNFALGVESIIRHTHHPVVGGAPIFWAFSSVREIHRHHQCTSTKVPSKLVPTGYGCEQKTFVEFAQAETHFSVNKFRCDSASVPAFPGSSLILPKIQARQ